MWTMTFRRFVMSTDLRGRKEERAVKRVHGGGAIYIPDSSLRVDPSMTAQLGRGDA
jgi:hypothetical protein